MQDATSIAPPLEAHTDFRSPLYRAPWFCWRKHSLATSLKWNFNIWRKGHTSKRLSSSQGIVVLRVNTRFVKSINSEVWGIESHRQLFLSERPWRAKRRNWRRKWKTKKGTPVNDHWRASALEIELGLDSKDLSRNKRLNSKDVNCGLNNHRRVKHE